MSSVLSRIEKSKLRDNVLGFISPEPRSGVVSGNSVAVAGDKCVLVVDAGHFPPVTASIISQIRGSFSKPVRFLVNTHWHNDHWRSNYLYRDEFPDTAIMSHRFTRDQIQNVTDYHPAEILKRIPNGIRARKEILVNGKRADGSMIGNEERGFISHELEDAENYVPLLSSMRVEIPNVTFDSELNVDLGNCLVKILHLGRANTAGDVVVFIPDSRVLITGDIVVSPTPYAFGSYLREWMDVLKKLKVLGATTLVPGHGAVLQGSQYVETLIELLGSVLIQVEGAVREELSLEETRKKINLDNFENRLAGTSAYRRKSFREFFVEPAVERGYLEAKFASEM